MAKAKTMDLVLLPKSIAEALYRAADRACTQLADMQPGAHTLNGRALANLAKALKKYERERTW